MEQPKTFEGLVTNLNRDFGDGTITFVNQGSKLNVDVIPTGAMTLDLALGVGGVPRSRIIEIFGAEGCGKTTLCLHIVANAQKKGGNAAYIDVEYALDMTYAKNLGVDINHLALSQPDTGEQALSLVEGLLKSNMLDVIVVDSVAALMTKAELEGEMGDQQMAPTARLMSQALRKLTPLVGKSKTSLIFINQLRSKIGFFMGDPNTTPGGRALKFYSSVRIQMARVASVKEGGENIGGLVVANVLKNKVASPYKKCQFEIHYGLGISAEASIIDVGTKIGIIKKNGSFLSHNDVKLGNGKMAAISFLKNNTNITEEIKSEIMKKISSAEGMLENGDDTEIQDQ